MIFFYNSEFTHKVKSYKIDVIMNFRYKFIVNSDNM